LIPLLLLALAAPPPPSVVLITLDTTRADYVGRQEDGAPLTPHLDALARSGTRFSRAVTATPLTLPAHCTLLTGLDPPAHGVRDNGVASLPATLPTLATAFTARGYDTAAFVSSRVLDRRFGLGRGFALYDDFLVAERTGEQGYPERDAAAVTAAALTWARARQPGRPYFLWIHYYDPHAPYEPPGPPGRWAGAPAARRYAGEIAYVDREVGRLLAELPDAGRRLVAAVGDHGEMLGEHGEKEHGILLYQGSLSVPLILAGPGVTPGKRIEETVGTRGLAATLLRLSGGGGDTAAFGPELPGLRSSDSAPPALVYSETDLPASAYGWSPLAAATDDRYRLIVAPRPELYDLREDPAETKNLWGTHADDVRRLQAAIAAANRGGRAGEAVPPSADLAASLRQLGYLSGSSGRAGTIDPKDGIRMLDEFEKAKALTRSGKAGEAVAALETLVKASPGNVPFLVRLAEAQAAAGDLGHAIQTMGEALNLNPGLDFLHLEMARYCQRAGKLEEAEAAYRAALERNPRLATAWLGLAELLGRRGDAAGERAALSEGTASGTNSGILWTRLAQVQLADGRLQDAERSALEASRLLPSFAPAWWVAGEVAEKQGNSAVALERFEKAASLGLDDPRALVKAGRLLIQAGRPQAARPLLERAVELAPRTTWAEDARALLKGLR